MFTKLDIIMRLTPLLRSILKRNRQFLNNQKHHIIKRNISKLLVFAHNSEDRRHISSRRPVNVLEQVSLSGVLSTAIHSPPNSFGRDAGGVMDTASVVDGEIKESPGFGGTDNGTPG